MSIRMLTYPKKAIYLQMQVFNKNNKILKFMIISKIKTIKLLFHLKGMFKE